MAIFDYDKKGIDAYNSVVNEDALVQKGLSVVYAGKKFPSLIPIKSSVVFNKSGKKCEGLRAMLLPLNYEDYGVESEYGYHVIEFLFKKEDLINLERMAEKSSQNAIDSIGESRSRNFSNLLFAFGIKHIGINDYSTVACLVFLNINSSGICRRFAHAFSV